MNDKQVDTKLRTANLVLSIVSLVCYVIIAVIFIAFSVFNYFRLKIEQTNGNNNPVASGVVTCMILSITFVILAMIQIVFIVLNIKAHNDQLRHIALGVLEIIFGNPAGGICLLCSGGSPSSNSNK